MAVISYKCPNCDGELVFDPASQNYQCEYCMSRFSQQELEAMKPDAASEQKAEPAPSAASSDGEDTAEGTREEAVVYSCPSCGAQVVTDATTAATFCYYCHNPVVLSGRLSGEYLPDHVIPFAIDKEQARKRFLDYVHSRKFIPRAFFKKQQIEKLSGIYFPYWVYECELEGRLDAQARQVRVWRSGEMEYTETKTYAIERSGTVHLGGITKNALKKADHQLAQGVLPYDLNGKKEFHMGYLSGFQAEKRDIEQAFYAPEVGRETEGYGRQMLRDTISGYSSVSENSHTCKTKSEAWSYLLLPVWALTYKARNGKMYYYAMNGQNGNVYGELPVDYKKIGILSGIVALAVLILFLIGGYLI